MLPRLLFHLAPGSFALVLAAACGSSVDKDDPTPTPVDCSIDAPGETFSFTVTNTGTRMLRLAYGCGQSLPVLLETSHGTLQIGPGVDLCEFTCDPVYKGKPNPGCSDCGPGYGADLGPGMSATMQWDRRVYEEHTAPKACSGSEFGNDCALGHLVKETSVKGTLNLCTETMSGANGYCLPDALEPVAITVDLTKTSATIEVQ